MLKNKLFKFFAVCILLCFVLIIMIISKNKHEVAPKSGEVKTIKESFGNININNSSDIFKIQNLIIKSIEHKGNSICTIDICDVIRKKYGLCYDRSLILQKIMIYNKIPVRPVFIYYNSEKKTSILDFFHSKTLSHNVFEFYYNDNWYMMLTNHEMKSLITIDEYIKNGKIVPSHSKYIRYLNNRNSVFISPSWLPDIYFFN